MTNRAGQLRVFRSLVKQKKKLQNDCQGLWVEIDRFYLQKRKWSGDSYFFQWSEHPRAYKRLFVPYNNLLLKSEILQGEIDRIASNLFILDNEITVKTILGNLEEKVRTPDEINFKKTLALSLFNDKLLIGDRLEKGDNKRCRKDSTLFEYLKELNEKRKQKLKIKES